MSPAAHELFNQRVCEIDEVVELDDEDLETMDGSVYTETPESVYTETPESRYTETPRSRYTEEDFETCRENVRRRLFDED